MTTPASSPTTFPETNVHTLAGITGVSPAPVSVRTSRVSLDPAALPNSSLSGSSALPSPSPAGEVRASSLAERKRLRSATRASEGEGSPDKNHIPPPGAIAIEASSSATARPTSNGFARSLNQAENGASHRVSQIKLGHADHETLAHKFMAMMAISTFAATAIIAFVSFARDVIDWRGKNWKLFQASMFCAFMAAATHLFIIIMAGRAAVIAFRIANDEDTKRNYGHYRGYLLICQQFSLIATVWFIVSVLIALQGMFESTAYMVIIYVYAGIGLLYILWLSPFRKDSVLLGNFVKFRAWTEEEWSKPHKRTRLWHWLVKKIRGESANTAPSVAGRSNHALIGEGDVNGQNKNAKLNEAEHPNSPPTPHSPRQLPLSQPPGSLTPPETRSVESVAPAAPPERGLLTTQPHSTLPGNQ
ncbi:hypothetical protein AX16_008891 [Volvariella volvacea WC 439]|nr:hypothetical protein AX16_008891 [Volvariella volvacea WC 439]